MHETLMTRRTTQWLSKAVVACTVLISATATGQNFPHQPISMIVGYPPGGSNDLVARIIAPPLAEALGSAVIVENRAGAGGTIGAQHVSRSKPDGHTILLSSASPVVLSPQSMAVEPYDAVNDLTAINTVGMAPQAIATNPKLKINTLEEFLEHASNTPATLSSSGSGSLGHLTIELLTKAAGIDIMHVPYKGATPAITDTLAGHVDAVVMDIPPLYTHLQSGNLNALAVTSAERVSFLNNVPTAQEVLPGFNVVNWIGIFGPANMPEEIVERYDAAIKKVIARDDIRAQLENIAVVPTHMAGPAEFQEFFSEEYDRWGTLIRESGLSMRD